MVAPPDGHGGKYCVAWLCCVCAHCLVAFVVVCSHLYFGCVQQHSEHQQIFASNMADDLDVVAMLEEAVDRPKVSML